MANETSESNDIIELNLNDDDEINDYLSGIQRLEPDIGLGNRLQDEEKRHCINPPKREEGLISFKHFLQNDRISSTTCPDLYSCSRQEHSNSELQSIDTDSPDLPDFVQDHIALEHIYFNDDSQPSAAVKKLPDFTSCTTQQTSNSRLRQKSYEDARKTVPLDLPEPNYHKILKKDFNPSLSFDLTKQTGCNSCSNHDLGPDLAKTGGRLPDFLSDGPVLGHNNSKYKESKVISTENFTTLENYTEKHNLISMLRQENNRLQEENAMFRSILMKKDDRIKELEDLVMALEISKLQMSSDANTQTSDKLRTTWLADSSKKLLSTSDLTEKQMKILKSDESLPDAQQNLLDKLKFEGRTNNSFAEKIKEMTSTSEKLARELLKIITNMQEDFNSNDSPLRTLNDINPSGDFDESSDLSNMKSSR